MCHDLFIQPRNSLCDLAGYAADKNVYRSFINWINRQPWRKVLPRPRETLASALSLGFCVQNRVTTMHDERVEVLLVDKKLPKNEQIIRGKWHVLLPHETLGPHSESWPSLIA